MFCLGYVTCLSHFIDGGWRGWGGCTVLPPPLKPKMAQKTNLEGKLLLNLKENKKACWFFKKIQYGFSKFNELLHKHLIRLVNAISR